MNQLLRLPGVISGWPVASQHKARRNAMIALNDCASRRAERDEVASFLAARAAPPAAIARGNQARA